MYVDVDDVAVPYTARSVRPATPKRATPEAVRDLVLHHLEVYPAMLASHILYGRPWLKGEADLIDAVLRQLVAEGHIGRVRLQRGTRSAPVYFSRRMAVSLLVHWRACGALDDDQATALMQRFIADAREHTVHPVAAELQRKAAEVEVTVLLAEEAATDVAERIRNVDAADIAAKMQAAQAQKAAREKAAREKEKE